MNKPESLPAAVSLELGRGNRNDNPKSWTTFDWDDPIHGPQENGELFVIQGKGSSGNYSCGLWRATPLSAGCRQDGSFTVNYSAPLGDETIFLLEGEAELTVRRTGKKHRIRAGDIMSHPKGLDITWDSSGPFIKKFWVIWDSPVANKPVDDLYVGSANGKGDGWIAWKWDEPVHGPVEEGEILVVRDQGATGLLTCGLWRTRHDSVNRQADGNCVVPYSTPLGDETFLLLEGELLLTVTQTGKQYSVKAGDIVIHPKHLDVHWAMKTPYVKKFFVLTDAGT